MERVGQLNEIIANYSRHQWRLRRVLLCPATRSEIGDAAQELFEDALLEESDIDALWFARPSYEGREAWELRLVAETPYALFQTFEQNAPEEKCEEIRRGMEERLREYSNRA